MKLWMHGLYLVFIGLMVFFFMTRATDIKPASEGEREYVENVETNSASVKLIAEPGSKQDRAENYLDEAVGKHGFDQADNQHSSNVGHAPDEQTGSEEDEEFKGQIFHQQIEAEINERIEQLDALFERESIDQDWAMEQEQNLNDLFFVNEELRDVAVDSVECRRTLCRVRLGSSDSDSLTTMMKIQRALMSDDWHNEEAKTYLKSSEDSEDYTLYTER